MYVATTAKIMVSIIALYCNHIELLYYDTESMHVTQWLLADVELVSMPDVFVFHVDGRMRALYFWQRL